MSEIYVDSDGARLWTHSQGRGEPVMLCNGGPGCCDYLAPVAAMIDDLARVIRFEQRGCGRSKARPPYDIDGCLADLDHIRQHYGLDRWLIGGHSWGAALALAYALTFPGHVSGLICIAGGRIHNDREWHRAYRRGRDAAGEAQPDFAYPVNWVVNRQVNASWKQYIQQPTLLKSISHLKIPALFVYGERDIRPGWPVEQVAHLMPGASFALIEGAAHYVWLTHADKLRVLLRGFLKSV